jgi:hypothetical protein
VKPGFPKTGFLTLMSTKNEAKRWCVTSAWASALFVISAIAPAQEAGPDRSLTRAAQTRHPAAPGSRARAAQTGQPHSSAGLTGIDLDAGRRFWSFQPLRKYPAPAVRRQDWPRGDIDRFVLAKIEAAGLAPAPDADRTTRVRRIYYDLTGLPPTVAEIDEFVQDQSNDPVGRLVDRLLESPHFGERWGRHWLDVARYADSSGGGRSLLFPNAWRYRDYVIQSVQNDKPYPQFLREQIAGDLLPCDNERQREDQLVATGFLMIGAHNYELQDKATLRMDVVDEQIEAVGRGLLGMTLGCARCHDHKFDPIPTTDYYALAGIFRSTKSLTPGNVSGFEQHELPVSPERRVELDQHTAAVKSLQTQLDAARAELKKIAGPVGAGTGQSESLLGIVVDDTKAKIAGNWTKSKFSPGYVGEGYIHDGASDKGQKSVTFPVDLPQGGLYEVRMAYTAGTNRSPSVPVTVRHATDEDTIQIDQRERPPIDGRFVVLGRWRFAQGARDLVVVSNEATTGHVIVDAVQFIPVELLDKPPAASPQLGGVRPEVQARAGEPTAAAPAHRDAPAIEARIRRLEADLKKRNEQAPEPPPTAMGVKDEPATGDFHVCIRGDVHRQGSAVPRGFLTVAGPPGARPPQIAPKQSGRLELADWLTQPDNPLTARVMVNRIWQHLIGVGLVRTADNFGSTGELPSHPELLDWLALRYIELGWSTKKLIREVVLSRTYQLASLDPAAIAATRRIDPDNRLLSHMNRKRLDAESIRDSILAISGQLDATRGGPSIAEKIASEYGYRFDSRRRSVYLPVLRNNLPDAFEVFDFADPNTCTSRRNVSTLPTQALFLMNSPFVMDQARHAAEALLELDLPDAERIDLAYRRTLARAPSRTERDLSLRYLRESGDGSADPTTQRLDAWARLQQALFAAIDFRYVH